MEIDAYKIDKITETDFIWKFVSIEKFLSIILNHKLHFTRLDKFEDSLEGIEPDLLLLNHTKNALLDLSPFNELKQTISIDFFPSETDALKDKLKEAQTSNFANCWFLSSKNVESVAMWNLYSNKNSVALKIQFFNFFENLKSHDISSDIDLKRLTLGTVDYINFQDPNEIEEIRNKNKYTPFIKDLSFSHENEIRIVAEIEKTELKPFAPKKGYSKYMQEELYNKIHQIHSIEIELNNFLDYKFEIIFHPKSEEWIKNDIKKILNKFGIPFETKDSKLHLNN